MLQEHVWLIMLQEHVSKLNMLLEHVITSKNIHKSMHLCVIIWCSTIWCSTVWCSTVWCSTQNITKATARTCAFSNKKYSNEILPKYTIETFYSMTSFQVSKQVLFNKPGSESVSYHKIQTKNTPNLIQQSKTCTMYIKHPVNLYIVGKLIFLDVIICYYKR